MAWSNVRTKKLRSALTIAGVVVGISSIGFLVSFGLGLQRLVTQNIIGDTSIKSIEVTSPNSRLIKLNQTSVTKMRQFPHIDKFGLTYSFPASIGIKGGGIDSVIYGVDDSYQQMTSLDLVKGRLLKKDDNKSAVISQAALQAVGIKDVSKAVNQKLDVAVPLTFADAKAKEVKETFTIVGVINSGQNNEIFIPSAIFDVAGVPIYKEAKVLADDTKNIPALRRQIESSGFQTSSPIDTLDQVNQLFKFFNIILAGFGGIGIIVAILGMFNTLTISLLERTKEIGLMVTLGGRRRDMRRLFVIEAVILSLIGAVIGIVLAIVAGQVVNFFINRSAAQRVTETFQVFYMPLWLMAALAAFMTTIGLIVPTSQRCGLKRSTQSMPSDANSHTTCCKKR